MATTVWKGYYEQKGQRHEMLIPNFAAAPCRPIVGSGRDHVGTYEIVGHVAKNLDVTFTKQYHNLHLVKFYGRFNDGKCIDGTWEIPGSATGKFHIECDNGLHSTWGSGLQTSTNGGLQLGQPELTWKQGGSSQWGLANATEQA